MQQRILHEPIHNEMKIHETACINGLNQAYSVNKLSCPEPLFFIVWFEMNR